MRRAHLQPESQRMAPAPPRGGRPTASTLPPSSRRLAAGEASLGANQGAATSIPRSKQEQWVFLEKDRQGEVTAKDAGGATHPARPGRYGTHSEPQSGSPGRPRAGRGPW